MAASSKRSLTRTWPEFFGGLVRIALFFAVVGLVFGELIRLPINGVRARFHYANRIPAISGLVPIGLALGLAIAACAVYGVFMRPRLAVDRVSERGGEAPRGGRVWTGDPSVRDDGGAGRHSADVTQ